MQSEDDHIEEESPESMVSREAFGFLGTLATTQILTADPKVRAVVRSRVVHGFLPIALGLFVGGMFGAHLGGATGWLAGTVIGLFVGLQFSR
jgi:hypothetical protein